MGYDWADNIHHIPFGLITQGGKKLSTRKGNVVDVYKRQAQMSYTCRLLQQSV